MPIFEYECPQCGTFELIRKLSDRDVKHCPECGAKVVKLISAPGGFEFKGSGFYQTDYKKKDDTGQKLEQEKEKKIKTNTINIPKVDLYEQFDAARTRANKKENKKT